MRGPLRKYALFAAGGLSVVAGLALWVGPMLRAASDLEAVSPASDAERPLIAWILLGTVAMVAGLALIQLACRDSEPSDEK